MSRPTWPHIEMTTINKNALVSAIAYGVASKGSTQYEFAREGFIGVDNMTQEQFNEAWAYWGGANEIKQWGEAHFAEERS